MRLKKFDKDTLFGALGIASMACILLAFGVYMFWLTGSSCDEMDASMRRNGWTVHRTFWNCTYTKETK
jgi:hypothetical protein